MKIPTPFLKKPIGAGDVIAKVTSAVGVPPCGGCKKRVDVVNRWVEFVPMGDAELRLEAATVGHPYTALLTPKTCIVAPGLPPGIVYDPFTGVLSGTPVQSGTWQMRTVLAGKEQIVEIPILERSL